MNTITEMLTTIALAIVAVGMVSVIVSRKSNAAGVIQSLASGFGNSLGVAESPVTGADIHYDLSYPSSGYGGFGG